MDKTKIDWCDTSWNPITGCLHGCEYCYAKKIANRFSGHGELWSDDKIHDLYERIYGEEAERSEPYPYGFEPTFHRYRLDEYLNKRGRNIFVCSMADLFGEWVPDSWIYEVFENCGKAPQHNYLFLTKNPGRYEKLLNCYMPPNMWFGWSQTGPVGTDFSFSTHYSVQTFISIEPLLRPFTEFHIQGVEWVIIGAETGWHKDKIVPKREWIESIVEQCRKVEIPVFMKSSLAEIWGEPLIQELPYGLKKGR